MKNHAISNFSSIPEEARPESWKMDLLVDCYRVFHQGKPGTCAIRRRPNGELIYVSTTGCERRVISLRIRTKNKVYDTADFIGTIILRSCESKRTRWFIHYEMTRSGCGKEEYHHLSSSWDNCPFLDLEVVAEDFHVGDAPTVINAFFCSTGSVISYVYNWDYAKGICLRHSDKKHLGAKPPLEDFSPRIAGYLSPAQGEADDLEEDSI